MRIAYITAGAAGMFCGSCMHDNTLVAELQRQGHDALLIPTYTPIRTDEANVSQGRVFFGGINVYLQEKLALFRHTPRFLDRLLDANWLLNWLSRFAGSTEASKLGDLTVSMLQGEHGHQAKEIDKLVDWLEADVRPDIIDLSNVLLSGMVHRLRERLKVPVIGTLQGDDIFLEMLPERHRGRAIDLISAHCRDMQGFLATSRYYADFMSGYLRIQRERIEVVYPGLNLAGHGRISPSPLVQAGPNSSPSPLVGEGRGGGEGVGETRTPHPSPPPQGGREPDGGRELTVGYFARIAPEKGLHHLVDAFCHLRQMPDAPRCKLRVSGWLGAHNRGYFEEQKRKLMQANLHVDFEHVESPDHASKVRFLQSIDVLSVPTTYHEPKGLYVLEAWANGVPVVQPAHGSFPELIEATGGGMLVTPGDPAALAAALRHLLERPDERLRLGRLGQEAVRQRFDAAAMARATLQYYQSHLGTPAGVV